MLVLSRKKGEAIEIGEDVVVTVARIQGDKVRLAIEAPKSVPINRGEVAAAIRASGCRIRTAAELLRDGV
jgi:carbon storage regulator